MADRKIWLLVLVPVILGIGLLVNWAMQSDASSASRAEEDAGAVKVSEPAASPRTVTAVDAPFEDDAPAIISSKVEVRTGSRIPAEKKSKLTIEKSLANISVGGESSDENVKGLISGAKDSSYRIRATSITMLGKTESAQAVEPLIDAMMDENVVVRQRAQNALKKLAGIKVRYDPEGPVHQREKAVEILREMLPDIKARLRESR